VTMGIDGDGKVVLGGGKVANWNAIVARKGCCSSKIAAPNATSR